MNEQLIKHKELINDNHSACLYYHPQMNVWIAYGKSAYFVRKYAKEISTDSISGFSRSLRMPFTAISPDVLSKIRETLNVQNETVGFNIDFILPGEISNDLYRDWEKNLRELSNNVDYMNVSTPVSQYIPKNQFIVDNMSLLQLSIKRILDFLAASLCILIFSPLFLACYIFIKMEDKGPAVYKQERIGRFGRPFMMYKFRSMRMDAEKMGPQLSHGGGYSDSRLTKTGRFIRAHHLDELPQLWNVIRGDMAFVGPRPERKFFIDQIMQYDQRYVYLYQIHPGVTSFATLYNGYTDTMEKMLRRLEYDLYYLGHRSLWFDTKVLFKTFCNIIFGKIF